MENIFSQDQSIQYEGPSSRHPFAFRYYDEKKQINNKSLKEHLRFSACYWHNFVWPGNDPFGGQTFERPWFGDDAMEMAKRKADYAFKFFDLLSVPYFCFHDRDIAPEGHSLKESNNHLKIMGDIFAQKMEKSGVKLLWGTANLFSHRRFMSGAATNPNPEVFAYAAAQIKNAMDLTHQLKGENYVLWGGREGYETLLNTNIKQELDQLGRILNMVVEYKHKIGFKGDILVEPKPQEPTKHQYDYDTATVFGFLQKYGLEKEVKMNLEANHATLAGHSFEHEVAMAAALDIMGSFDMNRGDPQVGWDTDQFPNNVQELVPVMYHIIRSGGLKKGGLNFDAKLRRQSIDGDDLLLAHIGAMDVCARAFMVANDMINDGVIDAFLQDRYQGWQKGFGKDILESSMDLEQLALKVENENINPAPLSGKQEYLENLLNTYL